MLRHLGHCASTASVTTSLSESRDARLGLRTADGCSVRHQSSTSTNRETSKSSRTMDTAFRLVAFRRRRRNPTKRGAVPGFPRSRAVRRGRPYASRLEVRVSHRTPPKLSPSLTQPAQIPAGVGLFAVSRSRTPQLTASISWASRKQNLKGRRSDPSCSATEPPPTRRYGSPRLAAGPPGQTCVNRVRTPVGRRGSLVGGGGQDARGRRYRPRPIRSAPDGRRKGSSSRPPACPG
ncbi:MAG: hypothetical protein AVDCRST_MAG28-478 [uncultured Rubrobacteraceae bacterium]|uniref:Uncharacterized protein n=1 Tax=uncultured Rubrobacteraceae bacterium TaxID=349277 RepID=A0A6J4QEK8_9ACTN|nr:MAG: hypothetical protein AVDCRST_MAG28-478 [uncultured Rubrobacteraceae bacterium]